MRKAILLGALIVLGATSAKTSAQAINFSNNFAFDAKGAITSWDGVPNAYPDMGAVSLYTSFGSGFGSAIDVPFELGYLNNGFLAPCDPLMWGTKTWTIGDGTHNGDVYTIHGVTTCPYFTGEWGDYQNSNHRLDGFSVDANFVTELVCKKDRFRRCVKPLVLIPIYMLTGGAGTVTDSAI
jgi:hypothetical protein